MKKINLPKIRLPEKGTEVPASISDRAWALEIAAGLVLSVLSVLIAVIA